MMEASKEAAELSTDKPLLMMGFFHHLLGKQFEPWGDKLYSGAGKRRNSQDLKRTRSHECLWEWGGMLARDTRFQHLHLLWSERRELWMRKEMLIYSEASRDPPLKYRVGFLKGLRRPHPFGNSLCCFCCCHPTKVRQRRGHRRGEQCVENSASLKDGATRSNQTNWVRKREKMIGKISLQHRNLCLCFLISALSLIVPDKQF